MDLLKKAEALNQKFQMANSMDKQEVFCWYQQAKKLMLVDLLKTNDGIKYLIDSFTQEVKQIDQKLLENNSVTLPDYQRDLLLIEKTFYKKFLSFFEHNDKSMEVLDKKIEENL